MLFYISCDNGAAGLIWLELQGTASIRSDLTFEITGADQGFSADLKGKFDNAASSAAGTLQVHLSDGGVSCDTGLEAWTATRK